ncbi:hypothetical protein [Rhodococcus sp. BS-15]|uniref:hypothetical protein n=1 Tax=Rhodococcus sp. BS-15 TaxID=1304954 RepID=UPI000A55B89F|nr:hypothetical protein [Rhodococcus sp. BS-15]
MADLVTAPVLELQAGDRVHERNDEWQPHPFSTDEIYIYTVESVERINEDSVLVGIVGGDIPSGINYGPQDTVRREMR